MFLERQKEKWKGDLQEIEQKRNELLPGHQRTQKRSQKLKKNYLKDACACDEEMVKVRDEINEREARILELAQKSSNCRMEAGQGLASRGRKKRQLWVSVQWVLLRLAYGAALHLGGGARKTASPARGIQQKVGGSSNSCAHGRKRRKGE